MSAFIRYTPISLGGGSGGGGSTITMGAFDGQAAVATGASIVASQLFMQSADATHPGLVNIASQTFAGQKTFSTGLTGTLTGHASLDVAASSLGNLTDAGTDGIVITGGTGAVVGSVSIAQHVADSTHNGYLSSTDWVTFNAKQAALTLTNLTDVGTDGIVITNGTGAVIGASPVTLAQHVADTTHNGYLSSTDWNTFNGKQAAGNYITALTGDGTASGPGSAALTLATVNSNVGSFGDSSHLSVFTVNGKGLVTAASSVASVSAPAASIFAGWDANKNLSANNHINGFRTTATAAGTTTLVVGDAFSQFFTGSTTQTVKMPVTSTLVAGMQYTITNLSSGVVTVQSSGANTIQAMAANTQLVLIVQVTGGTGTADWSWSYYTVQNALQAGTVTSVACSVPAFLSIAGSPITSAGTLAISLSGTALPIANGGTAKTSVTTVPAATSWAGWDANSNLRANNLLEGFTTTATAAGTTTLTVSSTQTQRFTGVTTQTVVLPDATTLIAGQCFVILNRSTGIVTVNANGGGLIQTMVGGSQATITVVTIGTSAGTWDSQYTVAGVVAAVNPTVQKFTSGTAQTYTTPSGVQYIRVRMVGGGGGGAGSGTANGTAAGDGGATLFGTAGSAGGGVKGTRGGNGGAGGASTLTTGAIGTALSGGAGGVGGVQGSVVVTGSPAIIAGGNGGVSALGGAGSGDGTTGGGGSASANTGSGGGGGASAAVNNSNAGSGGGAGGFVDQIITSPAASYTYTVGAAGGAGGLGASGTAGGAGAAGYIEVTEYYTNYSVGSTTAVSANTVLAGPASGAAAAPTFRTLAPADLNTAVVNGTSITITPSAGFGTVTLASANCAIIGKQAHIWGYFKVGTLAASTLSLGITGATIDSAQLTSQVQAQYLGVAYYIQNSGTPAPIAAPAVIFYDGSTTNAVFLGRTQSSNGFQKNNGSGTFLTAADSISYDFWIPIV